MRLCCLVHGVLTAQATAVSMAYSFNYFLEKYIDDADFELMRIVLDGPSGGGGSSPLTPHQGSCTRMCMTVKSS